MREVFGTPAGVAGAVPPWDVLERGVEGTARVDMTVVSSSFAHERDYTLWQATRTHTYTYRRNLNKNNKNKCSE